MFYKDELSLKYTTTQSHSIRNKRHTHNQTDKHILELSSSFSTKPNFFQTFPFPATIADLTNSSQ